MGRVVAIFKVPRWTCESSQSKNEGRRDYWPITRLGQREQERESARGPESAQEYLHKVYFKMCDEFRVDCWIFLIRPYTMESPH